MHTSQPYNPLHGAASHTPVFVDVPPSMYLLITGHGPRDSKLFLDASQTIFAVGEALKSLNPALPGWTEMNLEAIWKLDDDGERSQDWILMLPVPGDPSMEMYEAAVAQALVCSPLQLEHLLRFELFIEGRSAQLLHTGPFEGIALTQKRLIEFIHSRGFVTGHDVHDIYLKDVGEMKTADLQTIVRMPAWKE